MVVVNFYPLKQSTGRDLSFIDIGGPAMARAAAKNFRSCVSVPHPSWYEIVLKELAAEGRVSPDLRWRLAVDTLVRTGSYDAATLEAVGAKVDDPANLDALLVGLRKRLDLRYGENPHQSAGFFSDHMSADFDVVKGNLSYNNILDIDCCLGQLGEFEANAAVVVKHVGPCGVSEAAAGPRALEAAHACDPLSAFGGVIGVNFPFTMECADFVAKKFVECIVAPEFSEDALERLGKKKRTRLVTVRAEAKRNLMLRSAMGGLLVQHRDSVLLTRDLQFVSGDRPGDDVVDDLLFAWKVAKHVKSNAIVFAHSGRTLGIGAGQPSRVDAARIAIRKARDGGHDLRGSVMASDGFFPFPDSIELAAEAGVRAVVQPGGSIRDEEVTAKAAELGLVMALTSTRHFRH
jgi:phosphoribosylaminoimidazolecarboxamide formyltransferase/IMP cyclohydrolase